jgi:hypothetical protein
LTDVDWIVLEDVARLMVPFSVITKIMSTARNPILPGVIPYWNTLYDSLEDFKPTSSLPDGVQIALRNSARYDHPSYYLQLIV